MPARIAFAAGVFLAVALVVSRYRERALRAPAETPATEKQD